MVFFSNMVTHSHGYLNLYMAKIVLVTEWPSHFDKFVYDNCYRNIKSHTPLDHNTSSHSVLERI